MQTSMAIVHHCKITDIWVICHRLQSTFTCIVTSNCCMNSVRQALWYRVDRFGKLHIVWGKRTQCYLNAFYELGIALCFLSSFLISTYLQYVMFTFILGSKYMCLTYLDSFYFPSLSYSPPSSNIRSLYIIILAHVCNI